MSENETGLIPQTWQVELQCPQCGAPLILEETDRLLSCSFCRVRLVIHCPSHCRYHLHIPDESGDSAEDLLYVPYWRVRGMLFSCRENGVEGRVVDTSLLAIRHPLLPSNLGMRPQAMRLRFLTSETPGKILPPKVPPQLLPASLSPASLPFLQEDADSNPSFHEALVGKTVSLIHTPVRLRDGLLADAILNRPLGRITRETDEDAQATNLPPGEEQCSSLRFLPTLCPHCGWDMEGEKDALILLCRNCQSAWMAADGGFTRQDFAIFPNPHAEDEPPLYLPFWAMRLEAGGVRLRSFADLVRLANWPRAVRPEMEEMLLSFWVPAFKVRPSSYLRLARALTALQLRGELDRSLPRDPLLYPVTLPLREGAESLKPLIASLAVPKLHFMPRLPQIRIKVRAALLAFVPFVRDGTEFVHRPGHLSVSANALRWGRLI